MGVAKISPSSDYLGFDRKFSIIDCLVYPSKSHLIAVYGVSASEPLISEAASTTVTRGQNVALVDALANLLDSTQCDRVPFRT